MTSAALNNEPVRIQKDALLAGCVPLRRDLIVSTDFMQSATNKNERNEGSTVPVSLREE